MAILYSGPSSEIFLYNGEQQSYLDGLLGLYRTLWAHGIPADVITSEHDWSPYRVVWLPNTALLDAATVKRVADAVAREAGPCVVADGNLGSYAENGRFSYAPPEGLAELLGVRVADYDRFTPGRAGSGVLSGGFGHLVVPEPVGHAILEPAGDSRVLARLDGAVVGVERADRRLAWLALSPATAFGGTAPASLVLPMLASRGVRPPVAVVWRSHRGAAAPFADRPRPAVPAQPLAAARLRAGHAVVGDRPGRGPARRSGWRGRGDRGRLRPGLRAGFGAGGCGRLTEVGPST